MRKLKFQTNICSNPSNRKIALITRKGDVISVYNNEGNLLHVQDNVKQSIAYNQDFIVFLSNKYKGKYKMQICDYDFAILQTRYTELQEYSYVFEEGNYYFPAIIHSLTYDKLITNYHNCDKTNDKLLHVASKTLFATFFDLILKIAKEYQIPFSFLRTDILDPNFNKESLIGQIFTSLIQRIIDDLKLDNNEADKLAGWYIRQVILKYKTIYL
jgi:hypothetical protein